MQDDPKFSDARKPDPGEVTRAVVDRRAAAHDALANRRRIRLAIAQQTRETLRSHRAQIRGAAEGICLAARRSFTGGDAVAYREVEAKIQDCEEEKWDFSVEGDAALPITKNDMVRVIEKHPEGVSLSEIGNELGADWRGLVNWSHRLVMDGKVEKFDDLFYPARD
jgi:hypothetical protein